MVFIAGKYDSDCDLEKYFGDLLRTASAAHRIITRKKLNFEGYAFPLQNSKHNQISLLKAQQTIPPIFSLLSQTGISPQFIYLSIYLQSPISNPYHTPGKTTASPAPHLSSSITLRVSDYFIKSVQSISMWGPAIDTRSLR